jgi:hypothetical protein
MTIFMPLSQGGGGRGVGVKGEGIEFFPCLTLIVKIHVMIMGLGKGNGV